MGERARSGASYRRDRICAIGHAELAASAATACHLAPQATKMSAPATPPSPPTAAERSALRTINHHLGGGGGGESLIWTDRAEDEC